MDQPDRELIAYMLRFRQPPWGIDMRYPKRFIVLSANGEEVADFSGIDGKALALILVDAANAWVSE